jgi:hypothetical protein
MKPWMPGPVHGLARPSRDHAAGGVDAEPRLNLRIGRGYTVVRLGVSRLD